jgi:hypothetical protein
MAYVGRQGYIKNMKSSQKYFLARLIVASMGFSLIVGAPAQADTDPFPGVALGGEIGSRQAVSPSTGMPLDGSPIISCPAGAGLGAVADFLIGNYVVCTKTWRPPADVDADANFRAAQDAATAVATKQSQDWNAANPGQQKCFQWGPIVHANGVSTASGGVCANVVPVPGGAPSAGSDTATVVSPTPSPSPSSTPSDTSTVSLVETSTSVSAPTPTPSSTSSSAPVNGLAGIGGWAVIDSSGKVYGVIVCDNSVCGTSGSWGGVMPVEYMGCPAGCRLVLQTSADPQTGNVAGWRSQEGTDVVYNERTNTFAVQQNNQVSPTLIITPPSSTSLSFATPVNQPNVVTESSTVGSETTTARSESVTAASSGAPVIPIAPFSAPIALEPIMADVIPLESDGEEINEPPAAEIGVKREASGKFLITLESNIYEDQLRVRAFKKGSKLVIFKVSTNVDGRAAIRTNRNLAGFKLAVYVGDQFLDSVKI